jgi:hypothetical protein
MNLGLAEIAILLCAGVFMLVSIGAVIYLVAGKKKE